MQAVILGAGDGTRLRGKRATPKILKHVAGQTLLERALKSLAQLGATEFVLVTGYQAHKVEAFVRRKKLDCRYRLRLVHNEEWALGNARSVLAARDVAQDRFIVSMGDHLFDPDGLRGFLNVQGDFVGVFDSDPQYLDVEEATKADSYRGRVVRISKQLTDFRYVDVGLFVCSSRIFPILERCIAAGKDEWNHVKQVWIEEGNDLLIFDCKGAFWMDVDTPQDVQRAEEVLRDRLRKPRDGIISRYLNRPLSTRLSALLARAPITPNQITVISFVLALLAGVLFALGRPLAMLLGGLLAQASSVVDGCDGEIARMKGLASQYGAWFDAVLDRWADAFVLVGMTWGEWSANQRWEIWGLGSLAVAASIILSYSESRYEAAFEQPLPVQGWEIPAKRDLRLFLTMLGGLSGQITLALVAITLLSAAEVTRRLVTHYESVPWTPLELVEQPVEPAAVPPQRIDVQ